MKVKAATYNNDKAAHQLHVFKSSDPRRLTHSAAQRRGFTHKTPAWLFFLRYSVAAVCRTSVGLLAVFPPRRKSFEIWRATPGASLCEKRRHVLPRPNWLRARAPSAGAGAARPEEEARRKSHSWANHFTQAQQAKLPHSEQ